MVAISLLILLFPQKADEKRKEITTSAGLTIPRYEDEADRQTIMQNTWIFPGEIPSPFRIERTEEAEQKVVVQTLASQEIDRPAVKPQISPDLPRSEEIDDGMIEYTDGDIIDFVCDVFKDNCMSALKILNCESSGNRYAVNPETRAKELGITKFSSCGLFQINSELCEEEESILYNPIENINQAYQLYLLKGWFPWKNCAVKNNLL